MSRFFVGQPVKKVRGEWNIGSIFIVVGHDEDPNGMTLCVRSTTIINCERGGIAGTYPAGTEGWGNPEDFEPITPPHIAGSWEIIEQLIPGIREGVSA